LVAFGEAVAGEQLAASRARQRQDVLEVWGGGRHGADGRGVEGASHEREREHLGHAGAHLERHRVQIVVRDPVAGEVGSRPERDRAPRRPGGEPASAPMATCIETITASSSVRLPHAPLRPRSLSEILGERTEGL
jgi:hypothetical protein